MQEIPYKKPVKKGVAAQWGGYHASAGLGGGPSGGGLYAQAGVPGSAHASAGLYGGTEEGGSQAGGVDYGTGTKPPGQSGDGFFDRIFAVSITTLSEIKGRNSIIANDQFLTISDPNKHSPFGEHLRKIQKR